MLSRPQLQETFKLAISLVLFYWLALGMDWDMPKYGALAIVLISLGTTGASLQKGLLRLVGTTVGLAVGMLGLALFAQDRWLTLLFLGSYLLVVGYFMQVSRYAYAWFVAGFLAPLVWSTTYGNVDNAFHYASFSYLETSAGIVIYTVISAVLWPRRAGEALNRQGADLWPALRELVGLYRRQLEDGVLPDESAALRNRLVGTAAQMMATLQAAYSDTPSVLARKPAWEVMRVNVRAFGDALELWQACIDDGRRLDLDRLLPRLRIALDTVERRLERTGVLWQARASGADVPDADDGDRPWLEPANVEVDRAAAAGLAHFDRAALLGFVQQLKVLDLTSRELLRTMRVLAGLDPVRALDTRSLPPDLYRPSRRDPVRLINALFPGLCFALAFIFWILVDPPTGPSVPNMAATFGLLILLTPMRALSLVPTLLVAVWVAVAPVYFLLMPRLDSGAGLLALIFGYTFVASIVGTRSPGLKMMMLVMFVMMTGISNEQVYSFMGLVDGALMFLLALTIIAVVQLLLGPARPEHILLRSVRRFFRGCARITGELTSRGDGDLARGRARRSRHHESMVQPVPGHMKAVAKKLDRGLLGDGATEQAGRLSDAMQSIALRLRALEIAHDRLARHPVDWGEPLRGLGGELRERVQRVFERWSRLERIDVPGERAGLRELARGIETRLDADTGRAKADQLDDEAITELYATLGCARGLVRAVAETDDVVREINWDQWAEARF